MCTFAQWSVLNVCSEQDVLTWLFVSSVEKQQDNSNYTNSCDSSNQHSRPLEDKQYRHNWLIYIQNTCLI